MKKKRIRNRGIFHEHNIEDNEIEEPREVVDTEEAAMFIPRRPNMYENHQDNGEREEELGHIETEPVVNTDDIGDELDVDNYIRTVRENNQTAETESANNETAKAESVQQSLRRSKRNISLVSYSINSKSDLSSESASSYAPSLNSIRESTLSDSSTLRRSK